MKTIVRRHPLAAYYALTLQLSWGVVYAVVMGKGGSFPATPAQAEQDLPIIVMATLTGPSISSILLTLMLYGRSGLQDRILQKLFRFGRQRRGNQNRRWYNDPLCVVLLVPFTIAAILAFLCIMVSSELYRPTILTDQDKMGRILVGLGYGTAAGLFEEVGWTGWAVPETRKHCTALSTGLQVGLVWGLWHFLVAVWGSGGPNGEFDTDMFLPWIPWNLLVLPCFRVLMVYLYDCTESILAMALLHGSLTASLPLILMPAATGMALFHFYALFGLVLLVILFGVELASVKTDVRPLSKATANKNRLYAALLMTGASVLMYRTVSMIANESLSILVPWVAGLILLELCVDATCFLTAMSWLLSGDSKKDATPLQIGALSTVMHAVRVFVFAFGRLETQWKDFDVQPKHRAAHGERWNWAQVYFASSMSLVSLFVLGMMIHRRRACHPAKRDKIE